MVADDYSKEHAVTMKESLNIKVRLIKNLCLGRWRSASVADKKSHGEDHRLRMLLMMATYWQDKGGSANEGGSLLFMNCRIR